MGSIERRIRQLEETANVKSSPRWFQVIVEHDEDEDAVIERYRAEHPDLPDDANFIVLKIVSPQPREVRQ